MSRRGGSAASPGRGSTTTRSEPWQPFDAEALAEAQRGLDAPWWLAGGHALDLLLDRETRPHSDVDVVVLRRDQVALHSHFAAWDLRFATPDHRLEPWNGERLELPVHGIWARPNPEEGWFCEFLLDEAEGDLWVYRRDARVTRPLAAVGGIGSAGLPVLAPEVVLLHKAKDTSAKDEADFAATLPALSQEGRGWLAGALGVAHPDHPWLQALAASHRP